jgi:hypothetical protein
MINALTSLIRKEENKRRKWENLRKNYKIDKDKLRNYKTKSMK